MNTSDILSVACAIVPILAGRSIAATTESPVGVRVFQFRPGQLEVKAGTRVTWTNQDDITHTVTSGTPEHRDGRFDQRLDVTLKIDVEHMEILPGTPTRSVRVPKAKRIDMPPLCIIGHVPLK